MPVTKCAVIYSETEAGVVLTKITVPEHDDSELANVAVESGHKMMTVATVKGNHYRYGAPDDDTLRGLIELRTGKKHLPPCAVIDPAGMVVNVIFADDTHPHHRSDASQQGCRLVNHPSVGIGDRHDGVQFHRRVAVAHRERRHEKHADFWHPVDRLHEVDVPEDHVIVPYESWENEAALTEK